MAPATSQGQFVVRLPSPINRPPIFRPRMSCGSVIPRERMTREKCKSSAGNLRCWGAFDWRHGAESAAAAAACEGSKVAFTFLVNWFEEILGGQVIDETGLPGIYTFELKERVHTPEALMQVLRDEAGLVITREQREIPTLICENGNRNATADKAPNRCFWRGVS